MHASEFDPALSEKLRDHAIEMFESANAADGSAILVERLYRSVGGVTRTEVREWARALDEIDGPSVLACGRSEGGLAVIYTPLAPYKEALHRCHEQATEGPDGIRVPAERVKELLQAYVYLDQEHRVAMRIELQRDLARSVEKVTFRRAQVCQLLLDSLETFRVWKPEDEQV